MVRRKRPYVPKVKGCYECSQRRINCDQTRPGCLKCASRGISCSGFGVKFRFREGLSRGVKTLKWQMEQTRETRVHNMPVITQAVSPMCGSSTCSEDSPTNGEDFVSGLGNTVTDALEDSIFDLDIPCQLIDESITFGDTDSNVVSSTLDGSDDLKDGSEKPGEQGLQLCSSIDKPASWKDFLLDYFSMKIAPEMVVIDDNHNGWRHAILPMAQSNEIVMNSVMAAAAYHLAGSIGNDVVSQALIDPSQLYEFAIQGLQQRQQLTHQDFETQQAVILSIVVLLTAVMVNGCTDFPIMFQMLVSALDAIGGEATFAELGGEVAEFSIRQIRKMRVYAAPLLSPDTGLLEILCRAEESFDCLEYYKRLYPQHADVFGVIESIRQQAYNIYLDRALKSCDASLDVNPDEEGGEREGSSPSEADAEPLIEHFTKTLEAFPKDAPGEHCLVWPCYIAGSASRNPRHQAILEGYLERQYSRNGFANLLRAKEMLRYIWDRGADRDDWTAILPESRVFVM
ncbi:unnamed protein product [Clonostachys rosea]|uniref:Zn(2)-C6 fungal-type domain-containing protein n=1 Tax=Bionectria ochroleuca TaxID=29856 RepID=A0ABY6V1Y0_BIOOC|nr:unnamed protein product [Clonostachys rosea]